MKTSFKLATLGLGATLVLSGCGLLKKKAPSEATSATPVAVASVAPVAPPVTPPPAEAAPVAVAPPAALDEATVPAPQDFEDEAFEKVTSANFKAELQRLTKEISAK
jgi:hypothetical protein